ncbi:MAG: iron-containing alcohol dehydrogenase [Bacteroidales bacterium]|nr:iron-containing alcohol dehydrogenase [Bacteroidales bacterium]
MLGNFKFSNPTKLYFGKDSLNFLKDELKNYGKTVMLSYGGGSIKRNGIYDSVVNILKSEGKTIIEDGGVMSNPTVEKMYEGAAKVRDNNVDLILAVGGGSTIDYAKGIAASAYCETDPWKTYYLEQKSPVCKIVPVASILTMVGTGSEMNGGSVITNHKENLKIGKVFDDRLMPRFTILNPEFTYTVPTYQMVAGFFDIMSHLMEQYFSNFDDNTTDYLAEGLMRSLIHSSLIAVKDPKDYEARSNIMWTATWALNTMLKMGKHGDWMVHMIGQAIGAHTDATHGMTLAAVSIPYYKYILDGICNNGNKGIEKFKRFAVNVWNVREEGKDDRQLALEGINCLEKWMKEIGVVMKASELGVKEDMLEAIADSTITYPTDYRTLNHNDVVEILRQSL